MSTLAISRERVRCRSLRQLIVLTGSFALLKIRVDPEMLLHRHHTGQMSDRADHGSFFLPRVNAAPEFDRTVSYFNPEMISLTICSRFQCFLDLFAQFF